jgi:hypothetical protein
MLDDDDDIEPGGCSVSAAMTTFTCDANRGDVEDATIANCDRNRLWMGRKYMTESDNGGVSIIAKLAFSEQFPHCLEHDTIRNKKRKLTRLSFVCSRFLSRMVRDIECKRIQCQR